MQNSEHAGYAPPEHTPQHREIEITREQHEILKSTRAFAEYINSRWPQVDQESSLHATRTDGSIIDIPLDEAFQNREPKLNYAFSGSVAAFLLSKAETITEMEPDKLPYLSETKTYPIPEKTKKILASMARKIGDLDITPTNYCDTKFNLVQRGNHDTESYYALRKKFITKGAGGPTFDEIPDEAKACLNIPKNSNSLMCDPVRTESGQRMAKITVDGKEFYVTDPRDMVAYKILNMLQSYTQKPDRFNQEVPKLFSAIGAMYGEETVCNDCRAILLSYYNSMREKFPDSETANLQRVIRNVMGNEMATGEIKTIIGKLKLNET